MSLNMNTEVTSSQVNRVPQGKPHELVKPLRAAYLLIIMGLLNLCKASSAFASGSKRMHEQDALHAQDPGLERPSSNNTSSQIKQLRKVDGTRAAKRKRSKKKRRSRKDGSGRNSQKSSRRDRSGGKSKNRKKSRSSDPFRKIVHSKAPVTNAGQWMYVARIGKTGCIHDGMRVKRNRKHPYIIKNSKGWCTIEFLNEDDNLCHIFDSVANTFVLCTYRRRRTKTGSIRFYPVEKIQKYEDRFESSRDVNMYVAFGKSLSSGMKVVQGKQEVGEVEIIQTSPQRCYIRLDKGSKLVKCTFRHAKKNGKDEIELYEIMD